MTSTATDRVATDRVATDRVATDRERVEKLATLCALTELQFQFDFILARSLAASSRSIASTLARENASTRHVRPLERVRSRGRPKARREKKDG